LNPIRLEQVLPSQLSWISFSLGRCVDLPLRLTALPYNDRDSPAGACVDIKRRLPQHSAFLVAYVGSAADAWAVARTAHRSKLDGHQPLSRPAQRRRGAHSAGCEDRHRPQRRPGGGERGAGGVAPRARHEARRVGLEGAITN